MVSDTPSSKDEKKNVATTEDTAAEGPAARAPAPLPPKTDDAAVETAMADVAAAIKRHEDHQDEDASEAESTTEGDATDEDATDDTAGRAPPPEPPSPAPTSGKGRGFGGLLAAGVAGAVIALAGAFALSSAGLIGNPAGKVNDEIAALRQDIAALKANDGSAALQSQLDALKQQVQTSKTSGEDIASLKQQVSAIQNTQQSDVGAVKSLESRLDQLKSSLSTDQQAMQQKLSALEEKVNTPGKDLAVARAISAAALKSAIDRGDNFATELATYAEVAPENADISKLKALAASGIPTREELSAAFSDTADAIIAATEAPPPEGNIFNRLVDSARDLVSVRPVGDVEGDTVPAIVARIENALTKGDLKKAEAEWETLPAAGKQASQKFADGLKARIEADGLVSATLSSALGATAGAPVPATSSGN